MKLDSIGITFASLSKKPEEAQNEDTEVTNKEENNTFTQEALEEAWRAMCNRMPREMVALASRMKNVTPRRTALPEIEVTLDNEQLLGEVENIKNRIRKTLALALHNGNITINLRLAEKEEIARPLTAREAYMELLKNKEARKFCESLGLEITT